MNIRGGTLLWHKRLTGIVPVGLPEDDPLREPLLKPEAGDRGAWAEIRRCRTVGEALLSEPFVLYLRLVTSAEERPDVLRDRHRLAGLARAAIAVSQVRSVDLRDRHVGGQMGTAKGDRPRVPKTIAKSLFQVEDPDEALRITLNAIDLIGADKGGVNIVDLAFGMLRWPGAAESWAIPYYDRALAIEAQKP